MNNPEMQNETEIQAALDAMKEGRPVLRKPAEGGSEGRMPQEGDNTEVRVSKEIYLEAKKRFDSWKAEQTK